MLNQERFTSRILILLVIVSLLLSLGATQSAFADDAQQPTVSSGQQGENGIAPDQGEITPTKQSDQPSETDFGAPAQRDTSAKPRVEGSALWDQPLSSVNTNAYVDQDFSDFPTYSSYLADDFIANDLWSVNSIFIPGSGWNGFTTLLNATTLHWSIYTDNGGIPAGDPSGGGSSPVWSLSLAPTDPQVIISTGSGGFLSNTQLNLTTPFSLPPGHYWLIFYPTMPFTSGQYGRQAADTTNGFLAKFINPGGSFGYGTAWQDWIILGSVQSDMAFRIEGGVIGGIWRSINPINGQGRSRPAAASAGGKLYVLGGEIGGYANTVEEYDPYTGIWTTQSGLMPVPASNICAATIGTDIYIPGGYNGVSISTLQVYHTTSDTWTTVTTDPLPVAAHGQGCAALSGKLYVFGGSNNTVYLNSAYQYDPLAAAGSRWTILSSMPHVRGYLAGVAVNGKIYAVGGRDGVTSDFAYVEAYNPGDASWHAITNLNIARAGPGAFKLGKYLVVCGGGWASYYNSCERYDTSQGYGAAWSSMASLINGRRTFAYGQLGSALYAVAGYNGTFLTSAERWSIETFLPLISSTEFTSLGFDSQFNGNADNWFSAGGPWYYDSSNIFTEGVENYSSSAYYNHNFRDFDYSARMIRYGCDTCANRLIIRGTLDPMDPTGYWYSQYLFQYTRTGYYSVFKHQGDAETPLQGWTLSSAIITGDAWNTVHVIADGSNFYFFINGTLVWSGTDTSFPIGLVGVGMYRDTSSGNVFRVDWATLWADNKSLINDVVSPEQQMLNEAANMNAGGDIDRAP